MLQGDRRTWLFPRPDGSQQVVKAVFTLDASQDPKHFDWSGVDKPEEIYKRFYVLAGDVLLWSTNLGAGPRPASFHAGHWLFVMKRLRK